jgi:hypothetical protein
MINIGILYICTGKYNVFFEQFYESSENYFLNDYKKTYYVFTDSEIKPRNNIKIINQKFLGWPYDTMKRFHMFNSIKNYLENEDFLFFLNANMKIVDFINHEIIPTEKNNFLMGVKHPGFYNSSKNSFTYERRKESNFYIPYEEGKFYYQGCFNGGKTEHYLKMSDTLSNMIDDDLKKDIIPIWHDETALNWYFKDKNPLLLEPSYAYPELWDLPIEKKIIQLDKNKYGGHNYLRKT